MSWLLSQTTEWLATCLSLGRAGLKHGSAGSTALALQVSVSQKAISLACIRWLLTGLLDGRYNVSAISEHAQTRYARFASRAHKLSWLKA